MQSNTQPESGSALETIRRGRSPWAGAIPIFWGGLFTVAFYALIPYLPFEREWAMRYFCGHWVEYVTIAFFFWGMAILAVKAISIPGERAALAPEVSRDLFAAEAGDASARATALEARLSALPVRIRSAQFANRVSDLCAHVRGSQSSDRLEEHMKYLAEIAAERQHGTYALVRTITWAIPILGFLGTVIGITMAIANVTPEQLDTSLSEVTGGLGVAFDTTALSLALSLFLVFTSYVLEGMEGKVLADVEDSCMVRIVAYFPATSSDSRRTLPDAQGEAGRRMIERTEALIQTHTRMWGESLEGLRVRWNKTLEQQMTGLSQALQQGTAGALRDHAEQLSAIRGEFLKAFQSASKELVTGVVDSRQMQKEQQAALSGELKSLWDRIRADIARLRDEQTVKDGQFVQSISKNVSAWQQEMKQQTELAGAQLAELRKQREALLRVAEGEQQLIRLESRLSDNLESIRNAESFDQTLHSLNAAVHLLTARARPKAA